MGRFASSVRKWDWVRLVSPGWGSRRGRAAGHCGRGEKRANRAVRRTDRLMGNDLRGATARLARFGDLSGTPSCPSSLPNIRVARRVCGIFGFRRKSVDNTGNRVQRFLWNGKQARAKTWVRSLSGLEYGGCQLWKCRKLNTGAVRQAGWNRRERTASGRLC
jgi:hypothetical protein